jgi:hypothetical protein
MVFRSETHANRGQGKWLLNGSILFPKSIVHFYSYSYQKFLGKCALVPVTNAVAKVIALIRHTTSSFSLSEVNVLSTGHRLLLHTTLRLSLHDTLIQELNQHLLVSSIPNTASCPRQKVFPSNWIIDQSFFISYLTTSPSHLKLETRNNPSPFYPATGISPSKNSVSETWSRLRPWLPEMLERLLQAPSKLSSQPILVMSLLDVMMLIFLSK